MISKFFSNLFSSCCVSKNNTLLEKNKLSPANLNNPIGIIAGNSDFPLRFAEEAKKNDRAVVAVAHSGETRPELIDYVDHLEWIKVGELGRIIDIFKKLSVKQVALAGGINRIKLFGGVKLDSRGAALICRLKSTKDDLIMRGIAEELLAEGIEVVPCYEYLSSCLVKEKIYTLSLPSEDEEKDIAVGIEAIIALSSQHIGQLVAVREGVVVAVEAVEGSDRAILRAGELGGKGVVIVKFAKLTQDMRFDVPTIGPRTIESMIKAKARVLALEEGRCLIMDESIVLEMANKNGISIVGCKRLAS